MRYLFLYIILLFPTFLNAQTVLEGYVKASANSLPIDGAVVAVTDKSGSMVGYKIADTKGYFRLSFNTHQEKLILVVSFLGYETKKNEIENKTQQVNIVLNNSETKLKEVKVVSDPIWRREDTLVYNVNAFKSHEDRTIGDILKKLPGIEVYNNGNIKYNGEPINRFYIEGMDLLQNKYGIATNNVSVDEVKSVEVIENHQPLKTLRNVIDTEQAAINIKLKNNKMTRPAGTVKAGSGYGNEGLLWAFDAFSLQAQQKSQNILMYKTNNTGSNIAMEMNEHSLSIDNLNKKMNPVSSSVLIDNNRFSSPPIEDVHYLFNKTHIVTLNNLSKLSDTKQFRINANYLYDTREQTIQQNSSYYLQDSVLHINEKNYLNKRRNYLDCILTYTDNAASHYLNNSLKVVSKWDKTQSDILSIRNINQHYQIPEYSIQNELNFVKKWGARVWEISSFISYTSLPQYLSIASDTVADYAKQSIHRTGLYSNTDTYFSYIKGRSKLQIKLRAETLFDNLKSSLYNQSVADNMNNRLYSDYVIATVNPEYSIRYNRFDVVVDLPLRYHWYKVKDKQYQTQNTYNYVYATPHIRLKYTINPYINARASYGYSRNIGDIMDFTRSYIFTDYRYARINSGMFGKNKSQNYTLRINYRNQIIATFFNSSFFYIRSKTNLMTQQNVLNGTFILERIPHSTTSKTFMGNVYGGKYVSSIRTNFSLAANYSVNKSNYAMPRSQGIEQIYPVKQYSWAILPRINVKVSEKISVTYYGNLSNNKLHIEYADNKTKSSYYQVSQNLKGSYAINKKLQVNLQGEYLYNEITESASSELFFANLGISYKVKQLEFTFDWNNIFNEKNYSYVTYDGLNTYSYKYKIRPADLLLCVIFKY